MNSSIRIILVLAGALILIGILWDIARSRAFFRGKRVVAARIQGLDTDNHNEFGLDESLKKDPLQLDFLEIEPVVKSAKTILNKSTVQIAKPEIRANNKAAHRDLVVLHVTARQPSIFSGRKLFEAFHQLNLYHGEMEIFHRHENKDGTGEIIFSIASMVEPGTFQVSRMESFNTPGLSLFFQVQRKNQAIAAFELMLRIGKQLAARLDGELRDQDRKLLMQHGIEAYRERMRSHL